MQERTTGCVSSEINGQPVIVDKIGGAGSKDVDTMSANIDRVADNEAIVAMVV